LYQIATSQGSDSIPAEKMKAIGPEINDNITGMLLSPWFEPFIPDL